MEWLTAVNCRMSCLNSSVNSSTEAFYTVLQIYSPAVRHWKGRVAFTWVVYAIYAHASMKQIFSIVIIIKMEHSLHNATMEKLSLLQKPTNYYYGPNPLSGFNALLMCWRVCWWLPYQRRRPLGRNVCWTLSDCACAWFRIPTIALYWPLWSDCNIPPVITSRAMLLTGCCEWANILNITGCVEVIQPSD
jgi:hypothetical protein